MDKIQFVFKSVHQVRKLILLTILVQPNVIQVISVISPMQVIFVIQNVHQINILIMEQQHLYNQDNVYQFVRMDILKIS